MRRDPAQRLEQLKVQDVILEIVEKSCLKFNEDSELVPDEPLIQKFQYQLLLSFKCFMFARCSRVRSLGKNALIGIIKELRSVREGI